MNNLPLHKAGALSPLTWLFLAMLIVVMSINPAHAALVAEWRMDELSWSGTTGEVEDSSANAYHGTSINGATTTEGKVCRAGIFNGSNHINVPNLSNLLGGTASLAFWIKTTQSGNNTNWRAPGVAGVELSGGTNDIFWGWLDASGHIGVSTGNDNSSKSSVAINDGTWRHVVLTRDHTNGNFKIYIDGALNNSGTTGSGTITTPFSSIGRIEDTGGTHEHLDGELDEVMVFDSVLSDAQVLSGFNNLSTGVNWDGSERACSSDGGGACGIVAGNFTTNTANGTSISLDVPDHGIGDVLIAQVAIRASCSWWLGWTCNDISAPAGWELIRNDFNPWFTGIRQSAYYRIVDGTENTSYTWTFSSNRAAGGISAYSGVDLDDPIDVHSGQTGDDDTLIAPSLNTTVDDTLFLGLFSSRHGNTDVSPQSPLNTLYTARTDAGPNGIAIGLGHETQADAGATGTRSATASDNDYIAQSVALRPAACTPSGPDHIRLLHDGSALICQAEPVTVRACANSDCSSLYTDAVTVDLTSPALGWTPNPVTFSGGETEVLLSRTTAGTVTLNAAATSPSAANTTQCINSGGGNACELSFSDVGILIDGDDSDGTLASDIPMQITGKPSDVGYSAATQRVRVVRTDTQTGACIPGLENQTIAATFSYLVPTASEGLNDNIIGVSGDSSANLTTAGSGQTVQLAFDGNGTAPFSFTSQDAGRYQLGVTMSIPVTDTDGDPTGDTIAASDISNTFLIRPLAMFADASGNPRAQDAAGSTYQKAGETFSMAFYSLRWAAGRDNDNDGLWDSCGNTDLTDPGNYSRVPVWDIGQPAADLALPIGGSNSGLNYADGNIGFSAGTSSVTADNVSYDEVGIVQLQTNGINNFFGEAVEVCSPYIGRFYPDRFDVTHITTPACNATFTYAGLAGSKAGQPFDVGGTVTARNTDGGTTTNYEGDFAKLGTDDISALPKVDTVAADGALTWSVDTLDFLNGVGGFTVLAAEYAFNTEAAPQNMHLHITATDSDDVTGSDDDTDKATNYRIGRLRLQNAFGPELIALDVPLHAESFTSGSFYSLNGDDGCTQLDLANQLQLSINNGATWSDGDQTVNVGGGTSDASLLNATLDAGDAGLSFSAPGANNTGSIDVRTAIGASHPWLLFDWDGDGIHDDESASLVTFGIYGGSTRHIDFREVYD